MTSSSCGASTAPDSLGGVGIECRSLRLPAPRPRLSQALRRIVRTVHPAGAIGRRDRRRPVRPVQSGHGRHRARHPGDPRDGAAPGRRRGRDRPAHPVGPRERAGRSHPVAEGWRAAALHRDGRRRDRGEAARVRRSAWPMPAWPGSGSGSGSPTTRCRGRSSARRSRSSFPVFEVPYPVPFIAITEAVFTRILAEQYDTLQRAVDAEHVLTRAVMDGAGIEGIAASLAARHEGVGDAAGPPRHPARDHVARPRRHGPTPCGPRSGPRVRTGPASACRWSTRGITSGSSPSARRAVSRRSSRWASPSSRASSTASWPGMRSRCSRSSWRSHAPSRTRSGGCRATSSTSWRPGRSRPPTPPAAWPGSGSPGMRSSSRWRSRVTSRTSSREAVEDHGSTGRRGLPGLATGGRRVAPVPRGLRAGARGSGEGDRASGPAARSAAGRAAPSLPSMSAGASARRATPCSVCRLEGWTSAGFEDLGTYRLLLSMTDPDALRAFADSLLGPLDAYDRDQHGELVPSLRAFLAAQLAMGDGGRRAVRAPPHAPLPRSARSRSSPGATCRARSTGWSSGWPCGLETSCPPTPRPERDARAVRRGVVPSVQPAGSPSARTATGPLRPRRGILAP